MRLKYITHIRKNSDLPKFIIFSMDEMHDEKAKELGISKADILSAGFLHLKDTFELKGKSISLNIKSKEKDTKILKMLCLGLTIIIGGVLLWVLTM